MSLDASFNDWKAAEETAEAILPLVGRLYRDHGVVSMVHGTPIVQVSPVAIVRAHRRGHVKYGHDVSLSATRDALAALVDMGVGSVELDLGKLVARWQAEGGEAPIGTWVRTACAGLVRDGGPREARDVVLYGFGRIGRILARLLVSKAGGGDKYLLKAIVVRKKSGDDIHRRANLLRRDSVHGPFAGTVRVLEDEGVLLINGHRVHLIHADAPEDIDYTQYGIHDAVVIDNTGAWRDRKGLSRHLSSKGASRVVLTAPGKGDIPNLVYGINHASLDPEERILSAASCTTNAIVPVLKVMHDTFGVTDGHLETVHAYTNDQNLLDNFHKKARRGRSAALNLVITETGAAEAVAKALPELAGKLTGNAIRVPTPNVSLAILSLNLAREVTREEVNGHLEQVASTSALAPQIGFTAMPDAVSSDLVGDTHAGVVDAEATIVSGRRANLYVWYDNEYGYSCQVMRLLEQVADVTRPRFP